jgi:hypothetical protein
MALRGNRAGRKPVKKQKRHPQKEQENRKGGMFVPLYLDPGLKGAIEEYADSKGQSQRQAALVLLRAGLRALALG